MLFWEIEYMDGDIARQYQGVDPNNPPKTAKSISLVNDCTNQRLTVDIPSGTLPVYAKQRFIKGISGPLSGGAIIMIGFSRNGSRTMKCYSVDKKQWFNKKDQLGWQSKSQ